MDDVSVGIAIAWRFAAAEAEQARFSHIEPGHVLIGLCSLEKALRGDTLKTLKLDEEALRALFAEQRAVGDAFHTAGLDPRLCRRALRGNLGDGGVERKERVIHRSEACREIFSRAKNLADLAGLRVPGALHLLTAILEAPSEAITEVLGDHFDALRTRVADMLEPGHESQADITVGLDADSLAFSKTESPTPDTAHRLALLYDLPLQLGTAKGFESLLQMLVERLVAAIPGAMRGAVIMRDRASGALLLKAHVPPGKPSVSLSLVHKAIEERRGLVWCRGPDATATQLHLRIESGMYAPLIWKGEALGVVCVDNCADRPPFNDEDLRLMIAVAQYAAVAIAHHEAQEDSKRNATLLARLLTNFSPRVRDRLLRRAQVGRLRLGGDRSEVTILMSDIRGFTSMSAGMDADDVVDLLNEYFSSLVDVIFRHDGTIDKFVGDSILAVFGSPDPDPRQHENAVRAALAMQTAVAAVSDTRAARGLKSCEIGIGIHSGEVLHGFIGSAERMEFTVIGDSVNLAARYCSGAGPGEVIISGAVHERVWNIVESELLTIPTKHEGALSAFRVTKIRPASGP